MANITAAMVKELREMTSVGMMECKKALVEAEGDMDKAVDILRTHGLAAAAKKAGRATNEGAVVVVSSADGKSAAMTEVNCETDFVATNDVFLGYAQQFGEAVLANRPADVEALLASPAGEGTVQDVLNDAIHKIGENMQISRFVVVDAPEGCVSTYTHFNRKIAILVKFSLGKAETASNSDFATFAKDVAMQIAAMSPVSVSRDDVPADVVAHEMEIYKAQAAESGKPENIQEKIATGRMEKFYKESCLLEEQSVKDDSMTVGDMMKKVAKACGDEIAIESFVRYALGEN